MEVFEGRVSELTSKLGAFDPLALVSRAAKEQARRRREEEVARDAAAEDEDVAAERARVRPSRRAVSTPSGAARRWRETRGTA